MPDPTVEPNRAFEPPPPKAGASSRTIMLIVAGTLGLTTICCVGGIAAALAPWIAEARRVAEAENLRNDLKTLGLAYQEHHSLFGNAPKSWDDLSRTGVLDGATLQNVRSRRVNFVWGVDLAQIEKSSLFSSRTVIAYFEDESAETLPVLMADGSVWSLTHDEIEQRLAEWEAQKSPSDGTAGSTLVPSPR